MAEERICIRRIPNPCNSCNIKPCTRKCIFGTLYEKNRYSMTREEVIETITFALCSGNCENCSDSPKGGPDCVRWLKDCGKWEKAEAVLNALLEDK